MSHFVSLTLRRAANEYMGLVQQERSRMRRAALAWRAASLSPERVLYLDAAIRHREEAARFLAIVCDILAPSPPP